MPRFYVPASTTLHQVSGVFHSFLGILRRLAAIHERSSYLWGLLLGCSTSYYGEECGRTAKPKRQSLNVSLGVNQHPNRLIA